MTTPEKPELLLRVDVAGGKYTVIQPADGGLQALRYGAPWRDLTGDNLVLSLAQELQAARAEAERLRGERDAAKDSLEFALSHSAAGWDRLAASEQLRGIAEREIAAARSLAAELVEGLRLCSGNISGPIEDRIEALIAKARAAGIAPKGEKGETHD